VLQSAHWVTTFHWYVTCQAQHDGMWLATEAPDLIPGLAYRRPGDPTLAHAIADAAQETLAPFASRCGRNETQHFVWDYGSLAAMRGEWVASATPIMPVPFVSAMGHSPLCSDA